jgi:hypothetical protein
MTRPLASNGLSELCARTSGTQDASPTAGTVHSTTSQRRARPFANAEPSGLAASGPSGLPLWVSREPEQQPAAGFSGGDEPALTGAPGWLLPFARWGSAAPRAGGPVSAAAYCAERTIRRWPAITTTHARRLAQSWHSSDAVTRRRTIAFTRQRSGRWSVRDGSACSLRVSTASSRDYVWSPKR